MSPALVSATASSGQRLWVPNSAEVWLLVTTATSHGLTIVTLGLAIGASKLLPQTLSLCYNTLGWPAMHRISLAALPGCLIYISCTLGPCWEALRTHLPSPAQALWISQVGRWQCSPFAACADLLGTI